MDSANKTFFIMVVLTMVCFGITLYQFFNPATNNSVKTEESVINQNEEIKKLEEKEKFSLNTEVVSISEDVVYENDVLKVVFDSTKAEIAELW